jgi:hypothetical protein
MGAGRRGGVTAVTWVDEPATNQFRGFFSDLEPAQPGDVSQRTGDGIGKQTMSEQAMRRTVLLSGLLLGLTFATSAQADAYRWCAEYGGGRGGGTNCYFVTLAVPCSNFGERRLLPPERVLHRAGAAQRSLRNAARLRPALVRV